MGSGYNVFGLPGSGHHQAYLDFILRALAKRAGPGSVSQLYGYADPDPYPNITDPQHWFKL